MASISKDSQGNRRILFMGADGKRRAIRIGSMNAKQAENLKVKVETLASAVASKLPLDPETSAWLGKISDELASKLAAVGLMPERQSRTLGEFLNGYLERRKAEKSKPNTIKNLNRVITDLLSFFGAEVGLRTITAEMAESFKAFYVGKGLAPATIYRQLKFAKMFFGLAVQAKYISENPFACVKGQSFTQSKKQYYLSLSDTYRLQKSRTRPGRRLSHSAGSRVSGTLRKF